MFRIRKVLNHNSVIALNSDDQQMYLILGKGIGFNRKPTERIETRPEDTMYSLKETSERGEAMAIVKDVAPECLEVADSILNAAEKEFGRIDRSILFPMADHIAFAVQRMKKKEEIRNPLNADIQLLFHTEYKVAQCASALIHEAFHVDISNDEIGYIALHVHTAIEDEKVSEALKTAELVRFCISLIEQETGRHIEVMSLGYNRMMNHIRFMVRRILTDEPLNLNLNQYMKEHYPLSYEIAQRICDELGRGMKRSYHEAEIGYLAMHIERVLGNDPEGTSSDKL
ncbi:MAG: PRD domain-containing protein [Clostridium sp.]|nr:PRD domain-containing protein [Clostridium sp.]